MSGKKLAPILLLVCLLGAPVLVAEDVPKYGPASGPKAVPLSADSAFFRSARGRAPDFWSLIPFYVAQSNPYSCSAASVAALVNAAKRGQGTPADEDKNVTQADLMRTVREARWPERLSEKGAPEGRPPKHGVTLKQLEDVLSASLLENGVLRFELHRSRVTKATKGALKRLRRELSRNEESSEDFMLVHFAQDVLTGASGGPFAHISPIGAYDAGTGRVLILDVDRDWYEPYWVSDEDLLEAMSRRTEQFGFGGYLRVVLR